MELKLFRTYFPKGTNGELLLNGERVCYTIELPWKNNQRQVSCIPEGKYELKKRWTRRFGHHFILLNVPDRSYILVHAANDALKEIKGCIASVTTFTGEGKGAQARLALAKLVSLLYPLLDKEHVFLNIQSKKYEQHRE
jgi:hypothetical protein